METHDLSEVYWKRVPDGIVVSIYKFDIARVL